MVACGDLGDDVAVDGDEVDMLPAVLAAFVESSGVPSLNSSSSSSFSLSPWSATTESVLAAIVRAN